MSWWWCLKHSRPEQDPNVDVPADQRVGPYRQRGGGDEGWREQFQARNETWEREDERVARGPRGGSQLDALSHAVDPGLGAATRYDAVLLESRSAGRRDPDDVPPFPAQCHRRARACRMSGSPRWPQHLRGASAAISPINAQNRELLWPRCAPSSRRAASTGAIATGRRTCPRQSRQLRARWRTPARRCLPDRRLRLVLLLPAVPRESGRRPWPSAMPRGCSSTSCGTTTTTRASSRHRPNSVRELRGWRGRLRATPPTWSSPRIPSRRLRRTPAGPTAAPIPASASPGRGRTGQRANSEPGPPRGAVRTRWRGRAGRGPARRCRGSSRTSTTCCAAWPVRGSGRGRGGAGRLRQRSRRGALRPRRGSGRYRRSRWGLAGTGQSTVGASKSHVRRDGARPGPGTGAGDAFAERPALGAERSRATTSARSNAVRAREPSAGAGG